MSSKAQTRSRHLKACSTEPPPREPHFSPDIQDHIGQHLRAMYDRLKTEPVPDGILDLLKRLGETGPGQSHWSRQDLAPSVFVSGPIPLPKPP
jgi:Anti-sigma factor NepR